MHLIYLLTMALGLAALYLHVAEWPSSKWDLWLDLVLVFGSYALFLDGCS